MGNFQGFMKPKMPTIFLYFLFIFPNLCDISIADPPYWNCSSSTKYTQNSPFQINLNNLLQVLPSNASTSKFRNASVGADGTGDRVYALYMCIDYVAQETCRTCVAKAAQDIVGKCPSSKDAVVWEEYCQLRYSDENFFGRLDVSGNIPLDNKENMSQPEKFRTLVNDKLRNLTRVAAYGPLLPDMYATGEFAFMGQTVYALVQCTRDLSSDDCNKCLEIATREILEVYYFSIGARLLSKSCYLRYEINEFYKNNSDTWPGSSDSENAGEGTKKWKFALAAVGLVCLAVAVFTAFACYHLVNKRNYKRNSGALGQRSNKSIQMNNLGSPEFPCIGFGSILAATNNFSGSNKLGEGGFGPVYKGVLRDGREVAIKRLSFCSDQGSEEFTNEVLLIMKLQHKNLVKLLGFCVDGEEKLLVYEYMPNSSLDVILFDRAMRAQLDWTTRKKIIGGIAKGIIYLHEDSRLRIIHRDLKASNILLDSDMNPKISDFGMARIFAGSDGQANTATIVGTYGYMAPEYAMEGLYSVKSDVFSFGVLVIEIITGKRNAGFHRTKLAPCLLSYVWHLWHEGKVKEVMDSLEIDLYEPEEFSRYLHIGLLCVQEDAYDRPTMSSVVAMLKNESTISLCQPKRPAFSAGRFADGCESGPGNSCSVNGLTVSSIMPR